VLRAFGSNGFGKGQPSLSVMFKIDRYNVRNNTLYEEWNPDVRTRILNLLLGREQGAASE